MVLLVVLYGCETWPVMLREEHGLRVCENWVLGKKFGPKRKDITGNWRKLHSEELHDLYSSPNVIRVLKSRRIVLAGYVAYMGEKKYIQNSDKET